MVPDSNPKVRNAEAQIARLREKQARAQEKLAQVRGRGSAWNGHIVFEVDAGGKFLDLKLNPQAESLRIADLESEIKSAARAALEDAAKKAQEALAELVADPRIAEAMQNIKAFASDSAPSARPERAPAPGAQSEGTPLVRRRGASAPPAAEQGGDQELPDSWLERT